MDFDDYINQLNENIPWKRIDSIFRILEQLSLASRYGQSVILVEDDRSVIEEIKEYCLDLGLTFEAYTRITSQLIDNIVSAPPSLLIVDGHLSGSSFSGLQFIEQVRQMSCRIIPVIFYTGRTQDYSQQAALEKQATVFLEKGASQPDGTQLLYLQIKNLLAISRPPPQIESGQLSKAADALQMDTQQLHNLILLHQLVSKSKSRNELDLLLRQKRMQIKPLQALLKDIGGFTFSSYRVSYRLYRGKKLLEEGGRLQDISLTLGYAHTNNFITAFKRKYGTPPLGFFSE